MPGSRSISNILHVHYPPAASSRSSQGRLQSAPALQSTGNIFLKHSSHLGPWSPRGSAPSPTAFAKSRFSPGSGISGGAPALGRAGSSRDVRVPSSGHKSTPPPPGVLRPRNPRPRPSHLRANRPHPYGRRERKQGSGVDCTCAGKSPGYPFLECSAVSQGIQDYISHENTATPGGFGVCWSRRGGGEAGVKEGVIRLIVCINIWSPDSTKTPEVMG